ncbi:TadE/TadG family protein [Massilia sp. YIM B02763]|uniref:TadE/TadG family type IV pilus assembly protein n=1 Tax=Massilia sp. YIM B02763 TaxID=3050130 RepID=UPI0025B72862|nr:TadE/TadG family protein [Massilia sp. YIM B02763]MDN4055916.1 TadE/TadG family protein [Massilia sp. YIM B02763]
MHQRYPTPRRQGGAVAIMVAISMVVLLGAVGLVVDAGLAYLVKARLNAAVDSAALAGARAVTDGSTQAAQIASAQAAAATFFAANIPTSYMFSKPKLLSTNVTFNGGRATIDVTAEAPLAVSFMQVLGFTSLKPVAYAQTIRNDLDMALVIDTSGSLKSVGNTVKASTKTFLNKFNSSQDRVSLIHFSSGAEVDNPINTSARGFTRTSMSTNIDAFQFEGGTNSSEGMWNARNQLNLIPSNNRSVMRVIVFFSDGVPTSFSSSFTFNPGYNCSKVGAIDTSPPNQYGGYSGLFPVTETYGTVMSGCTASRVQTTYTYFGSTSQAVSNIKRMPDAYNAHPDTVTYPLLTDTPRQVTTTDLTNISVGLTNISRVARNLPEAMAAQSRAEGVYVFTLGLGSDLKKTIDGEIGEDFLKCMANVPDAPARCYKPNQPVGMYCYAATEADLTPCFSRLATAILRITK